MASGEEEISDFISMTPSLLLNASPGLVVLSWGVDVHVEFKVNSISLWSSSCSSCSFPFRFCLCFLIFSCLVLRASGQKIPWERGRERAREREKRLFKFQYINTSQTVPDSYLLLTCTFDRWMNEWIKANDSKTKANFNCGKFSSGIFKMFPSVEKWNTEAMFK